MNDVMRRTSGPLAILVYGVKTHNNLSIAVKNFISLLKL